MHNTVEDFLTECCDLIDKRQVDLFLNDYDNRSTMELMGYNPRAVMQEIKELKANNLYEGPIGDHNSKHGGYVWIFKKEVNGVLLYIKLKIRLRNGKEVFLMSFHPDR